MNIQAFNGTYNPDDALQRALALSVAEIQPNRNLNGKYNPDDALQKAIELSALEIPPHAEEADSCSICLETWKDLAERSEKVVKTKCGHLFCEKEIADLVARENTECPLCRGKIDMKDATPVDMSVYKVAKKQLAPEPQMSGGAGSSSSSLNSETMEKIKFVKNHPAFLGTPFLELTVWEKAMPLVGTFQSKLKDVKTDSNIAVGSVVFIPRTKSEPTLGIVASGNLDGSFLVLVGIDTEASICYTKAVARDLLMGVAL